MATFIVQPYSQFCATGLRAYEQYKKQVKQANTLLPSP
jgi:hypothetical protein